MSTEWKIIPGYSDYEISNFGEIRSIERTKKYKSGRTIELKAKLKKSPCKHVHIHECLAIVTARPPPWPISDTHTAAALAAHVHTYR